MLNESVAKTLKRNLNGTQQEIAVRTGFSQYKISRIVSGKQPITIEELKVICDSIGIEPHKIVMDAEDAIKHPF